MNTICDVILGLPTDALCVLGTLAGVLLGNLLSRTAQRKAANREFLVEAYVRMFTAFYQWDLHGKSHADLLSLFREVKRVQLICSPRSHDAVTYMMDLATRSGDEQDQCSKYVLELFDVARDELNPTLRSRLRCLRARFRGRSDYR